jgi:hypothetical protein
MDAWRATYRCSNVAPMTHHVPNHKLTSTSGCDCEESEGPEIQLGKACEWRPRDSKSRDRDLVIIFKFNSLFLALSCERKHGSVLFGERYSGGIHLVELSKTRSEPVLVPD